MASTAPPTVPPRAGGARPDDPRDGARRPGAPGAGTPAAGMPGSGAPAAPAPRAGDPATPTPPALTFVARLRLLPDQLRRWLRPDPARPPGRWPRRYWIGLVGLYATVAAVMAGDAWVLTCGFEGCPSTADIRALRPSEGGRILDRGGTPVGRVRAVRRVNVSLSDVPLHVRQAFVATEDRRFFDHHGVDWRGAVRATFVNLRAGGVREGFSTITMQVVRNTFAVQRQGERSVARKLLELRLSRLIEGTLTKSQILELYLNVIYLGTASTASRRPAATCSGAACATCRSPRGRCSPRSPRGRARTPARPPAARPAAARPRARAHARQGYVSADRARRAQAERLTVAEDEWRPDAANNSYALDAVRQFVDSLREAEGLESVDLNVETTIDLAAQRAAERAVARAPPRSAPAHRGRWSPSTRAPATCARSSAGASTASATRAAPSTAPCRRAGSPARRSSRSSTPPRSPTG
jgi:membrane peptidoglycan carboxypeptidase